MTVEELKKKIGNNHFLYNRKIWAVAKCERNGDVLYVSGSGNGKADVSGSGPVRYLSGIF